MQITGTHFNYYCICKRKLWLFVHGITLEHTSDIVTDGKLLHEASYPQRASKHEEISLDGIKVDYYDAKNKVIHEIKRSNKIEEAHILQVKYYISVFEAKGMNNVQGIIEYPLLHKNIKVLYSQEDKANIEAIKAGVIKISHSEHCPPIKKKSFCKNCSYYDFCFVAELAQ